MGIFTGLKRWLRDEEGMFLSWGSFLRPTPRFNDYSSDIKKLILATGNPALCHVLALNCDLGSLGIPYCYKTRAGSGKEVEIDDPVIDFLNNPNPLQSGQQFQWDLMFWKMLGNAYVYIDSNVVTNQNKMYCLDPSKMEFPDELEKAKDKLFLSDKSINDLGKIIITYRYDDGSTMKIPFAKIMVITDLSNGIGNWFKGPSRIDALKKVLSNSEMALDAKNVNLQFAGQFVVSGVNDPDNITKLSLSKKEKEDIEDKYYTKRKPVHVMKSPVDIKRFVSDMAALKLDEAYHADYFTIGSMFNIPRDVLESSLTQGATYENQEKATAKHVSYSLQPGYDDFGNKLANRIEYTAQRKKICYSWDHLPFMQVMEADRVKVRKTQAETFKMLLDQGVSLEEINEFLDTNFKTGEKNTTPSIINQPVNIPA